MVSMTDIFSRPGVSGFLSQCCGWSVQWVLAGSIILCATIATAEAREGSDPGVVCTPDSQSGAKAGGGSESPAWTPPPPPPDEFDWIQLTSGEWLKGEFKALYDDKLEFDSKELDLLTLDWEDVKQVRGHRYYSVRFEGMATVVGRLQVVDDRVVLGVGDEKLEYERNRLVAVVPGGQEEKNYWSAKVSLGFNVRQGNTDQVDYSAQANILRRTATSRTTIDYIGNFTRVENIETTNNHRFNGSHDLFQTRKFYWRPIFGEYFRDPYQNIGHRITLGAGAGYHIIDTPKTEWDVSGGPAYQYMRFDTVEEGEPNSESTPALVLGTDYETELTKSLDLIAGYKLQVANQASGGMTHHAISTLEVELTKRFDLDISLIWDRIQDPVTDADGSVPKQDDLRFIFGLGLDL